MGCLGIQHGQRNRQDRESDQDEGDAQHANVALLLLALVVENRDKKTLRQQATVHAGRHEIEWVVTAGLWHGHAGVFDGDNH